MVCRGVLEPEKLPPKERAAHYHSLRVHLQVIEWKMFAEASNLDPKQWGWKLDDGYLTSIATEKEIENKLMITVSLTKFMIWKKSGISQKLCC